MKNQQKFCTENDIATWKKFRTFCINWKCAPDSKSERRIERGEKERKRRSTKRELDNCAKSFSSAALLKIVRMGCKDVV